MNSTRLRLGLAMAVAIVAGIAAAQDNAVDPVIESARNAAADFGKSLPDYVVRRTTTRYAGDRPDGALCLGVRPDPKAAPTSPLPFSTYRWSKLDAVSGNVTLDHGAETYTDITVNGKPAKKTPADGIWTVGEFSSSLLEILDPKNATRFTNQRQDTTGNRPSVRYDYAVDAAHSTWNMQSNSSFRNRQVRYSPAYDGAIWIDRETGQVLRIEKTAHGFPPGFPLGRVESSTDYNFVAISGEKYVLPTQSETYSCPACGYTCARNDTVFADYKKFEANTSITFGGSVR